MSDNITTKIESGILYITINRETKLNALNIATLKDIKEAVLSIYENKEVCGVILTGAGAKAFAAGADIAEFANFNVEEGTRMSEEGHAVLRAIDHCPKPIIAAINGFVLRMNNDSGSM